MQRSGLILSIILVLLTSLVYAECSYDDSVTYVDVWNIDDDENCVFENETLWFFENGLAGSVKVISVKGNLTFNNVSLYFSTKKTSKILLDGGNLRLNATLIKTNSSINPHTFKKGNISILAEDDSYLELNHSMLYHMNNFSIDQSILRMLNVSYFESLEGLNLNRTAGIQIQDFTLDGTNTSFSLYRVNDSSFNNITILNVERDFLINESDNIELMHSSLGSFSNPLNITVYNANFSLRNTSLFGNVTLDEDSIVDFYDINVSKYAHFLGNGTMNQYWSVRYNVTNEVGLPLTDSYIRSYSRFDLLNPFIEGYVNKYAVKRFDLLSYVRIPENDTFYSNYTTNVTRSKYQEYTSEVNVTQDKNISVIMKTLKGIVRAGKNCTSPPDGNLRDFCTEVNPITSKNCLNMSEGDSCIVNFNINATDNQGGGSYSLVGRNFSFFMIAESSFTQVNMNESDILNVTIVD